MSSESEKAKQKEIEKATQSVLSTILIVFALIGAIAFLFYAFLNVGSW